MFLRAVWIAHSRLFLFYMGFYFVFCSGVLCTGRCCVFERARTHARAKGRPHRRSRAPSVSPLSQTPTTQCDKTQVFL
jgi:hypothetical protein